MNKLEKFGIVLGVYVAGCLTGQYLEQNHFIKTFRDQAVIEEIVKEKGKNNNMERVMRLYVPLQPDEKFEWKIYDFTEIEPSKFHPSREISAKGGRLGGNFKKPF